AGGAVAVQVRQRALGIAVLPGIQAFPLAVLEQLEDAFRGVPGGLVLAQEPVEMRIAVNRVASDDQARHFVWAKLDGRQQRISKMGTGLGRIRIMRRARERHRAGRQTGRLLEELAAGSRWTSR